MRKRETVKIDNKEFTIKELTVKDIIRISSESSFLSGAVGGNKNDGALTEDIGTIIADFDKVLDSCCDFTSEDLKELAPSEIRILYDAFKVVNSDFLFSLKALGIAEALENIKDATINGFSKTLVTLSNRAM